MPIGLHWISGARLPAAERPLRVEELFEASAQSTVMLSEPIAGETNSQRSNHELVLLD